MSSQALVEEIALQLKKIKPKEITPMEIKRLGYEQTKRKIVLNHPVVKLHIFELRSIDDAREVGFSFLFNPVSEKGIILQKPFDDYVAILQR